MIYINYKNIKHVKGTLKEDEKDDSIGFYSKAQFYVVSKAGKNYCQCP